MKKFTSLAAALCLATAFCGMCAGCATNAVQKENQNNQSETASVTTAAAGDYKLILNPGWYYNGSQKVYNELSGMGVTKITDSDAVSAKYFVENGYVVSLSEGAALPTPTGRTDATFKGWRRAEDGELVTYTLVPKLTEDMYLYAEWVSSGSVTPNPNPNPDLDPTPTPTPSAVTVNGKTMTKNPTPDESDVTEEYMLIDATFAANEELVFKVDNATVTINSIGSSSGIVKSGNTVKIGSKGGTFSIYLKHRDSGVWDIYGAIKVNGGEAVTAGNVYLAGVVADADINWNNWSGTNKRGVKATKSGNTYTLTVTLTKGDDCKFVMYNSATSEYWQKSLSGSAASAFTYSGSSNMKVNTSGTYTFTITLDTGVTNSVDRLDVSVVAA